MSVELVAQHRELWSILRNFLYPMSKAEVTAERVASVTRGDLIRAGLVDHYLKTEFGGSADNEV